MIVVAVIIIGGGVGAYFLIQSSATKTTIAPDYSILDLNDNMYNITSLQPKTVILDFMSVTCIPCNEMYPRFTELLADANFTSQIEIISIETNPFITEEQLEEHVLLHNMTWSVALAPEGMWEEYGGSVVPTIVVVDGEGKMTFISEGVVSLNTLKEEVTKAIEGEGEGIQLTSYQGFIIGFAIIVAITSFFSPCSFPLLPGYVAHILGIELKTKKKEDDENVTEAELEIDDSTENISSLRKSKQYLIYTGLGLSGGLGIIVSYLILGIIISAVGSVILPYVVYVLPVIGGIFIIFGALMFTNIEISFSRILGWIRKGQVRIRDKEEKTTIMRVIMSTFLYGLGYGIASLGCNAPIFLGFSLQVSAQETVLKMVFAYLAFALPIILLMIGVTLLIISSKDVIVQKMKSATKIIKIASGVIMIIVGIYLIIEFILGIV